MKKILDEILIEETIEDKLFPNSLINSFSMIQYMTILPIEGFDDLFGIYVSSCNKMDSRNLIIDIKKNDIDIYHDIVPVTNNFNYIKRLYFYHDDVFEIHLQMIDQNNEMLNDKTMIMNNDEFSKLKENGTFRIHCYPKISVVTRIKNMSNQVDRLYNSLLMQTYKDFEWIIFDNHSTDDIYAKVHEWSKNDINIQYKRLPEFMNFWQESHQETNGEIIVVCDADDFLTTDALEVISNVFNDNLNMDLYIGKSAIFGSDNMKLLNVTMFNNIAYHPTCYRRKCIKDVMSKYKIEYPLTDDHEILCLIMCNNHLYYQSNEILYYYRKFNAQSITWNSTNLNNYEKYPDWQKSSDLLDKKIIDLNVSNYDKNKLHSIIERPRDFNFNLDFEFQNKTFGDRMKRLHILTITDKYDNAKDLIISCNKHDIFITILGLEQTMNMENNFRRIMNYIDKFCDEYDIILYTDRTSYIFGNIDEILDKFTRFKKGILFSAEQNCYPNFNYKEEFDSKTNSKFRYLHDGGFIGYAAAVRNMLDTCLENSYQNGELNSQGQLQIFTNNEGFNNIGLDTECEIFMPLYLVDNFGYKIESNRIRNTITKTFPSILIGNGPGFNLLNDIKEKI